MIDPTVITLTKSELGSWVGTPLPDNHLVLVLAETDKWLKKDLKPLVALAQQHEQQHHKSVAVVHKTLALQAPDIALHLAPTLQEAIDLIELDEIERDLWK